LNKESIIEAIKEKIGSTRTSIWFIGITGRPDEVRQHYEKNGIRTTCWTVWQTDSERDLEDIVEYFLVQGMKQGIKSDSKANYLYVF
jgi:hypothetical protein